MNTQEEITKAKELLKQHGYYVDRLWHIRDVHINFNCTDEAAQEILDGAFNNEATTEQIWFAIKSEAEALNKPKYKDGWFMINGFFKDEKAEFSNYLVYEHHNIEKEEGEEIFWFGLSENDIIEAIKKGYNNDLCFVITSYKKVIE